MNKSSNTILSKISSVEFLTDAWMKLNKSNLDSHGISDESIRSFLKDRESKILSISEKLRSNKYKFHLYRPVLIPKKDGTYRPLQIPEIEDRIVFKALAIEIETQFKDILDKSAGISFAYQKKLGIRNAIEAIQKHYTNGNCFVFESDLINFFTSVNKEVLLSKIITHLSDDSINELLINGMNMTIGDMSHIHKDKRQYFDDISKGIPQGNPLSPLFANIYLQPFDEYLQSKNYNLVRYADDFVILCPTLEICQKAYNDCCEILKHSNINLSIHPLNQANKKGKIKTRITNLNKEHITFLSITFDGKNIYPSRDNVDLFKTKVRDACYEEKSITVNSVLSKIANKLDGWISAFYYTDVNRYAKEIDYYINRELFLILRKFDWKLSKNTLGKIPKIYKTDNNQSTQCLSNKQRLSSGIPLCRTLIKQKRETEKLK